MILFKKHTYCLLTFVLFGSFYVHSQQIESKEAKVVLNEFFFNKDYLKANKIKTISVSFSSKKPLQPIRKEYFKSSHFLINKNGYLTRSYFTKRIFGNKIDTAVEWRFYKNDKLSAIKKTGIGGIDVKSIFYENGKPAIYIYGLSQNGSKQKLNLFISSYKDRSAEYIEHTPLNKRDTLIKYKSVTSTVFKKELREWKDSITFKISYKFPLAPEKNYSHTFKYSNNRCKSIVIKKLGVESYSYLFQYSERGKLLSFTKFNIDQNTSVQFSELIYNDKTNLLRAIITKDLFDNTILIKKYSYTYYD